MANENILNTNQLDDIADAIDAPKSAELGPSTTENQQLTPVKKSTPKKADAGGRFGKIVDEDMLPEDIKEARAIEQHKTQAEKAEQTSIKEQQKTDEKVVKMNAEIDKIRANIDYAKQNNLNSSAMESRIQELEAEKMKLEGIEGFEPFPVEYLEDQEVSPTPEQIQESRKPATQEDISRVQDPIPSQGEVQQAAEDLKNQRRDFQAQQINMQDEIAEQRFMVNEAMDKIRQEDLKLNAIDPNRFWNNKSTWQKIGLGIAMILGGGRGGSNKAVDVVNNFINQDIEAQKLDNKSKLAKREEAYRRVTQELNKLEGLTKDQDRIDKIQLAKQKVIEETMKVNAERTKQAQLSAMKDFILKKGIKLENLSSSQVNAIFTKDDFKRAKEIRQEYNAEPVTKDTAKIVSSYGRIVESAKEPSAAGDMAMIFNFMKMLDPGSVVRESEFQNAARAGALTDRVAQAAFDKVVSGRLLAPNQRDDFLKRSSMLLKGQLKSQNFVNNKYRNLSKRSGVPSSLIVTEYPMSKFSKKEAVWNMRKAKNPKSDRKSFDKSWKILSEKYNIED